MAETSRSRRQVVTRSSKSRPQETSWRERRGSLQCLAPKKEKKNKEQPVFFGERNKQKKGDVRNSCGIYATQFFEDRTCSHQSWHIRTETLNFGPQGTCCQTISPGCTKDLWTQNALSGLGGDNGCLVGGWFPTHLKKMRKSNLDHLRQVRSGVKIKNSLSCHHLGFCCDIYSSGGRKKNRILITWKGFLVGQAIHHPSGMWSNELFHFAMPGIQDWRETHETHKVYICFR